MSEYIKKERVPTSIKFEKELIQRIREDAEKERRSITGQIEYMLKKYYEIKDGINR